MLTLALLFGACMPDRVEVGRDSTLDSPGGGTGMPELACPPENSQKDAVWPLDTFCETFGCPSTVDEAKVVLLNESGDCDAARHEVSTGCDDVQVESSASTASEVYLFRGDPQVLVGAAVSRDAAWGPCSALRYLGGVSPRACDMTSTCSFCGADATCPP
jgi:hypothetical protein